MLDLGVHLLDAARFMAGEPVLRAARAHTAVTTRPGADHSRVPVDVDDWAWAELELPGGTWLTVEASRLSLGAEGQPFEAYGSEGSLVGDLAAGSLALRRFDGDEAAWRAQAARDPLVLAAAALRPPPRLTLGSFVDAHAASLLHHLLRSEGLPALVGGSAADELAPSLADALAAERLAHAIIEAAEPAAPSAATD
jgi:predicted dehydrogenase